MTTKKPGDAPRRARAAAVAAPGGDVPPSATGAEIEHRTAQFGTSISDLDNLLVSTNIPMLLVDRRLCIRRFTPAATSLFSLRPGDIGRPIRDLSQKFTDASFLPDVLLVLEGGNAVAKEVHSNDGHWYVRQTLPYRVKDGAIEGAVITFSDFATEALQEARLYAESIVNSVREALVVLDKHLRIQSVNQPFATLFRLQTCDVIGQPLHELGVGAWNVPGLMILLRGALETGVPMEDFEFPYRREDGELRDLAVSARKLHRGNVRADLLLVAIEDMTERRRIEALLRESDAQRREEDRVRNRQLELANALRTSTVGELATGLAHELNQPLSSIANTVEACLQYVRAGTMDGAKLLELLSSVAEESQRAAGIVAHLRSFVEKGVPQLEPVDLGEVVAHVPHLLVRELEKAGVALRIDLPSGELPVQADRIQIEQVIVNLIHNAVDSIREAERPQRLIEITARPVHGMGEVSVRDTGTGVSDTAAERLFQAFFTTKREGLGMGLALSRSILEAHQGRIWMERPADAGPGIVVRFSIPLAARPKRRQKEGKA